MAQTNDIVIGSDGNAIPITSVAHTYGYSGSNIVTDTVVYQGKTYVQTFTYTGGNLTGVSLYVKQ
jgi:hypothetical protein